MDETFVLVTAKDCCCCCCCWRLYGTKSLLAEFGLVNVDKGAGAGTVADTIVLLLLTPVFSIITDVWIFVVEETVDCTGTIAVWEFCCCTASAINCSWVTILPYIPSVLVS